MAYIEIGLLKSRMLLQTALDEANTVTWFMTLQMVVDQNCLVVQVVHGGSW